MVSKDKMVWGNSPGKQRHSSQTPNPPLTASFVTSDELWKWYHFRSGGGLRGHRVQAFIGQTWKLMPPEISLGLGFFICEVGLIILVLARLTVIMWIK